MSRALGGYGSAAMTQPQGGQRTEPQGDPGAIKADPRMNSAPEGFNAATELPEGFLEFYLPLHQKFTPRQRMLASRREEHLARATR